MDHNAVPDLKDFIPATNVPTDSTGVPLMAIMGCENFPNYWARFPRLQSPCRL
jgi:hypothetical protein